MESSLEMFFERLLTDAEFRDKFLSARTAYEGYQLAKEYIPNVSFEEFKEGVLITDKKLRQEVGGSKEISLEDAKNVSGGAKALVAKWSR